MTRKKRKIRKEEFLQYSCPKIMLKLNKRTNSDYFWTFGIMTEKKKEESLNRKAGGLMVDDIYNPPGRGEILRSPSYAIRRWFASGRCVTLACYPSVEVSTTVSSSVVVVVYASVLYCSVDDDSSVTWDRRILFWMLAPVAILICCNKITHY